MFSWLHGWEAFNKRLVGLTKRAIRKSLGIHSLIEKQLATVLTDTKAVINSRPLVYVYEDI